jgi:hypothetical protein
MENAMKFNRLISALVVAVFVVALAACAPMTITGSADVENTSFGSDKRFAVVSIAAMKTFQGEKGITQLFKDTDEIPGANTQPLINALKPTIIKSLESDKNINLVSERKVLGSEAYKKLKEDERKMEVLFMSDEINVAKSYKYVSGPQKYAQLARDLNVDGVIGIHMTFTVASSKGGLSINGLSFGRKSYSPTAAITAVAYDQQGNVIWEDSTVKEAEPSDKKAIFLIDFTDITNTNFTKMHPKAIEIGGKAVEVLLARLDDTINGKGTSFVQSVK